VRREQRDNQGPKVPRGRLVLQDQLDRLVPQDLQELKERRALMGPQVPLVVLELMVLLERGVVVEL